MNNSTINTELWTMAPLFKLIDKYPKLATFILWVEVVAALYAMCTYNFTTAF